MIYIIDHQDSFTWNVVHQFSQFDKVYCSNYFEINNSLLNKSNTIVLSPGPGSPKDYPNTSKIYNKFKGRKKIIGICLGYQQILHCENAKIIQQRRIFHGYQSEVKVVSNKSIFRKNSKFKVGRYHSLKLQEPFIKENFYITMRCAKTNIAMAFENKRDDVYGFQFHPESFLTTNGKILIKSAIKDKSTKLVALTENRYINKKISGIRPELNTEKALSKANVIIDFTIPKCTFEVLKIASKLKKKVVIGTTGFTKKEEDLIKKFSKKIPILKAGNMSLGINLLMYLTEITSASLGNNYLSKVFEVHHKHKKDHPSGTALMLGKGIAVGKNKNFYKMIGKKYLNKKNFPYGKKINFNSIRKGEIIGEHEVTFSSGKEIITLNHEAFDRALYSEGAITAAKWLINKKPGLYSMRDLLNFK